MGWQVEIRDMDTDEIVEVIDCKSERNAERVEGGASINLNHEKYYTEIVELERKNHER